MEKGKVGEMCRKVPNDSESVGNVDGIFLIRCLVNEGKRSGGAGADFQGTKGKGSPLLFRKVFF